MIFSIIIALGGVDNIEILVRNLNIDVNNIIMRCGNYIIALTLIYLSQDLGYIFVSIIINLVIIGILRAMHINNIKNIEEIL